MIELSNQQIEEGKRVKICKLQEQSYNDVQYIGFIAVTFRAFVYVPLNLATSISGMNLRELNGSGKSLCVFLCTATIALLTTGALWLVLEEVKNYLRWRRRIHQCRRAICLRAANRHARVATAIWAYRLDVGVSCLVAPTD